MRWRPTAPTAKLAVAAPPLRLGLANAYGITRSPAAAAARASDG